ncbi:MAG: hypothetical protein RDU30_16935 [Desulfovibrionaceae bacterium]|nr:hypothetical protein [Desulfovibrionaceae bacterium]
MLRECVEWLLTPTGWAARRMGLLRESVAMGARSRRCSAAWGPHVRRCREAMLQAAQGCAGRRTVVVCGSGYCHDVPVAQLAGMFGRVVLADVVHPLRTRWMVRRYGNVRLAEVDLTGMLHNVGTWRAGLDVETIRPVAPSGLTALGPDLTISANVLSQLPLPVMTRLMQLGHGEAETAQVCRRIVQAHVDWLEGLPGVKCLITDTVSRDMDGDAVLDETDLLYGMELAQGGEAWTWALAPRPEVSRRFDRIRQVAALTWPLPPDR